MSYFAVTLPVTAAVPIRISYEEMTPPPLGPMTIVVELPLLPPVQGEQLTLVSGAEKAPALSGTGAPV
jgi:hypothetical protein